jgi:hypothetical protein
MNGRLRNNMTICSAAVIMDIVRSRKVNVHTSKLFTSVICFVMLRQAPRIFTASGLLPLPKSWPNPCVRYEPRLTELEKLIRTKRPMTSRLSYSTVSLLDRIHRSNKGTTHVAFRVHSVMLIVTPLFPGSSSVKVFSMKLRNYTKRGSKLREALR